LANCRELWPAAIRLSDSVEQSGGSNGAPDSAAAAPDAPPPANSAEDDPTTTVSVAELKTALQNYGRATEDKLIEHVKTTFPKKIVPRALVRSVRVEQFGKPPRGRPKRQSINHHNKSP
jgi:hypothetical protein